jgi:hypothetical protein
VDAAVLLWAGDGSSISGSGDGAAGRPAVGALAAFNASAYDESSGCAHALRAGASALQHGGRYRTELWGQPLAVRPGALLCCNPETVGRDGEAGGTAKAALLEAMGEAAAVNVEPPLRAVSAFLPRLVRHALSTAMAGATARRGSRSVLLDRVELIRLPLPVPRPASGGGAAWALLPFTRAMRFAPALRTRAIEQLARWRDSASSLHATTTEQRPLVALHWRRGDFATLRPESAADAEQAAAAVLRWHRRRPAGGPWPVGVDGAREEEVAVEVEVARVPAMGDALPILARQLDVFVATNAAEVERQALYAALERGGARVLRFGGGGGGGTTALHPGEQIVMEQVLCAVADAFVGSARSTFSKEIHLARRRWSNGAPQPSLSLSTGGRLLPLCEDEGDTRSCEQWFDAEAAILWARKFQLRQEKRKLRASSHV